MTQQAITERPAVEGAKPEESASKRVQEFFDSLTPEELPEAKKLSHALHAPDFDALNAKLQKDLAAASRRATRAEEAAKAVGDPDVVKRLETYDDQLDKFKERAKAAGVPDYALRYLKDFEGVSQAIDDFSQAAQKPGANGDPQYAAFLEQQKSRGSARTAQSPASGAPASAADPSEDAAYARYQAARNANDGEAAQRAMDDIQRARAKARAAMR